MRRDPSGRRGASAVATPYDALLEPRCPQAPASTGLPYGLRYWITGGLGALGVGLALSLSAGTAAAAPAAGSEGGGASTSSGTSSIAGERPDRESATGSGRTASAASRPGLNRKAVRTVRSAGPVARDTVDPGEPVDETTSTPDTGTDTAEANEKPSAASSSGRPGETGEPAPTPAKSVRDDADERTATTVSAPSTRTVAAADALPAAAALTATAGAPAIPGSGALVNGRVVVGTVIVDLLNVVGLRLGLPVPGQFARLLPIAVPSQFEVFWFTARRNIYGSPGSNPGGPGNPGNPGQLPLIWETNFDSEEEAARYWTYHTGRWGASAGDKQYYTDGDNDYIDADGNLVIEARRETPPDGASAPYNYTSSRMVTYGKQTISVGQRVVARIQMPTDKGTVPAFWTLGLKPGDEFDFPSQGEIDIAEVAGHGTEESRRTWVGNLHGGAAWNEDVEIKMQGIGADLGEDLSNNFHEFGMDWHADRIVWHIDGVEVAQVTQQEWEAVGGDWTPFSGVYDHYLILNIAVGNNWTGNPPADQPFQSQMKVDWVKVYSLDTVTV
ncbi:family 16 glycosylhydrolase [Mycobacterium sp. AMU20-3851]|uniref:glycoside hydrolase family 16 protein n=1 Tax=Mycobacterium sp. AMU20-3851 TaxID=3122055 RepID=UPI003753F621